jgi:hypothetical protein
VQNNLKPLEMAEYGRSVACTPAAADLVTVAVTAFGVGYIATRANIFHHGGYTEAPPDEVGVTGGGESSVNALLEHRSAALGG